MSGKILHVEYVPTVGEVQRSVKSQSLHLVEDIEKGIIVSSSFFCFLRQMGREVFYFFFWLLLLSIHHSERQGIGAAKRSAVLDT